MSAPNPLGRDHDTEDAAYWYQLGLAEEAQFCQEIAPKAHLQVSINPAKAHDKYAIDLLLTENGATHLADLKCQRTPFFVADRYGKNPELTVTFNCKDLRRYISRYPQAHVLFYVKWETLTLGRRSVQPVEGVWRATVAEIAALVAAGRAPVHAYEKRVGDRQNARDSHLISLTDLHEVVRFV